MIKLQHGAWHFYYIIASQNLLLLSFHIHPPVTEGIMYHHFTALSNGKNTNVPHQKELIWSKTISFILHQYSYHPPLANLDLYYYYYGDVNITKISFSFSSLHKIFIVLRSCFIYWWKTKLQYLNRGSRYSYKIFRLQPSCDVITHTSASLVYASVQAYINVQGGYK